MVRSSPEKDPQGLSHFKETVENGCFHSKEIVGITPFHFKEIVKITCFYFKEIVINIKIYINKRTRFKNVKRKIYQELVNWKEESNGRSAMLIEGARRVGKSYIAEEFARNNYKSYILINFDKKNESYKQMFDDLSDIPLLLQTISKIERVKLYERESLIIFDEVQKCTRAREAIKFLVEDGRYDYLETGSLISIKENVKNITIPSE